MKLLADQQLLIPEDQYIEPLNSILDESTKPVTQNNQLKLSKISKSLDELFPEQKIEEKQLKRTKQILSDIGNDLSNEQIRDISSQVQYIVASWLDDFERKIFAGLTLQELLHEKGGM